MKKLILLSLFLCVFVNAANYITLEANTNVQWNDPAPNTALTAPTAVNNGFPASANAEDNYSTPDLKDAPNYADSVKYYEDLANAQASSRVGMSTGSAYIAVGVVGLVLGLSSFIAIFADEDRFCEETYTDASGYHCSVNAAGGAMILSTVGFAALGGTFLPIGIVKKSKYNRTIRKEQQYRSKARDFTAMSLSQLYFKPEIDISNKALGAKIALRF